LQRGLRNRFGSDVQARAVRAQGAEKKTRESEGSRSQNKELEANLYREDSLETVSQHL
jgi:hypothetical protein